MKKTISVLLILVIIMMVGISTYHTTLPVGAPILESKLGLERPYYSDGVALTNTTAILEPELGFGRPYYIRNAIIWLANIILVYYLIKLIINMKKEDLDEAVKKKMKKECIEILVTVFILYMLGFVFEMLCGVA